MRKQKPRGVKRGVAHYPPTEAGMVRQAGRGVPAYREMRDGTFVPTLVEGPDGTLVPNLEAFPKRRRGICSQ